MSVKRIMKSSIDWVAFAERVPLGDGAKFASFKAKSIAHQRSVLNFPEELPKIDWNYYISHSDTPEAVKEFKKQYESLKVPYAVDKWSSEIDNKEKEAMKLSEQFIEESNHRIKEFEKKLEWWKEMIPFEHMTLEECVDYFPEVKEYIFKFADKDNDGFTMG